MKIFLSYGHDRFAVVAKKLKEDLVKEGYEVWIDSDEIRGGDDWEIKIENGLHGSDWIVLLMTEHSVRRPDGVCLDEISYARQLGKQIAPIMVQEVRPPLCIARIQWIDMVNLVEPDKDFTDEETYQRKKNDLVDILKGICSLNYESGNISLKDVLNPLDNDVFSQKFKKNFYGRQRLIDYFDKWYQSDDKLLWITGSAGMGKTAFVARLASFKECVAAVHFCRYNDSDRANPKKAISSIAYYLSTQIPKYKEELTSLSDLRQLSEKSTSRIFDYLIVEPLSKIDSNTTKVVVVIDALDEATVDDNNELVDVLATNMERTPGWIKFLITSRQDLFLERKLSKFRTVSMDDESICDNSEDIRQYLSMMLKDHLPPGKTGQQILTRIVEKSQGIFLYAKTIVEDICAGRRKVSDVSLFPDGLTGIYLDYFDRIVGNKRIGLYKTNVRPILEVLCTTYMPVGRERLSQIVDIDEYDIDDALELIYEMFPNKEGNIEPIHKSIVEWLTDSTRSGKYRVSAKKGHNAIAEYCLKQLRQKRLDKYSLQFVCGHLIAIGRDEDLLNLFPDCDFWEQRKRVMDTDMLLQRMIIELSLMNTEVRGGIFQAPGFNDIVYSYGADLFNKGLFVQLKKLGFTIPLHVGMSDKERLTALRYYYVNGDYATIGNNMTLFETDNNDNRIEPYIQNTLGLVTKKCGMIVRSAAFYKKAIQIATKQNIRLESIIYFHLNLSRIYTILCQFDDSRNELGNALDSFYHKDWQSGVRDSDFEFKSRQLELAVRYVNLETELTSANYNPTVCETELAWSDQLYSSKMRIDRYYPRHLQSKILFLLREHRLDEIEAILEELEESQSVEFDRIRTQYYLALYQFAIGHREESIQISMKLLAYLKAKDTLLIEKTECLALIDILEGHNHSEEVKEELRPWYHHTIFIINKILN